MYNIQLCLAYIDHIIKLGVKQRSRHGSFIGRSLVSLLFAAPIPTGILFVKVFALVVSIIVSVYYCDLV